MTRRGLKGRRRSRGGFTITEVLAVCGIMGILTVVTMTMLVTTIQVFYTELRQNETNSRCRALIDQFTTDVQPASQVVYLGGGPFTIPTAVQAYYSSTSIPAANDLVVFTLQSYDSQGIIPGASDYVGYGWDKVKQTIVRTCLTYNNTTKSLTSIRTGSTPTIIPYGGSYDSALGVQVHVASSSTSTYKDQNVDPFSGTNITLFQGSTPTIKFKDIDDVSIDATVSATSFNQPQSQDLHSDAKLRNWRQS